MYGPCSDFDHNIQHARRLFQDGRNIPQRFVSDDIRRSWNRSREFGISESDRVLFDPISASEIKRIDDQHRRLIAYAEPEMRRLFETLDAAQWVLACLEDQGCVVKSLGGMHPDLRDLGTALRPGINLSESVIGTNAPGCVLVERRPAVVRGAEHFLDEVRTFTCIAVPIFYPSGRIAGVLNATRHHDGQPIAILEPLALAARAIENRMVADIDSALRIRVHYSPELACSPVCGLIALSPDGLVLGANPLARQLLGLDDPLAAERSASEFFAMPFGQLVDALRRDAGAPIAIRCQNGMRVHAVLDGPVRPSAQPAVQPVKQTDARSARPSMLADTRLAKTVRQAERAFAYDLPVLINGETGTGKELLARHLHASGPRRNGPFVAVNCSAIPSGLIESELFGYDDGAFTGARRGGMSGRIEQANGGTLFLDEIGDMPLELQARLLRVLQERTLTRLGSTRMIPINCSLICATHRDLNARIADGHFREDLYYRIKGMQLALPPLRERGDLDALIDHLLAQESDGGIVPRLSDAARKLLRKHRWPGNIRELQQVMRLGIALAEDDRIDIEQLPSELATPLEAPALAREPRGSLENAELTAVKAALGRNRGNISATARDLGVTRATLYRKLRHFRLDGCTPASEEGCEV